MAVLTTAATAAGLTYVAPLLVSAGMMLLGTIGGYYFHHEKNQEAETALKKSHQKSTKNRHASIERLAKTTADYMAETSLNIKATTNSITKSATMLEQGAETSYYNHLKLRDLTDRINQVSQIIEQNAPPLLEELQKRILTASLTEEEQATVKTVLAKTVEELEEVIARHVTIQKQLQHDNALEKKTIQGLAHKLTEATDKLGQIKKHDELIPKITFSQNQEITALRAQNKALKEKLRQLSSETSIEKKSDHIKKPASSKFFTPF